MTTLLGTGSHVHAPDFSDEELAELNRQFETAPARAVIEWAVEQFHPFMCLAASMTDAVLIDLAVSVEPSIEVVFIDTRYHFPETLPDQPALELSAGQFQMILDGIDTADVRRFKRFTQKSA